VKDERGALVRGKRPPEGEPVVDRALSLLAAFDAGRRRLTLAELSRRSGMPVSTTLRLATRLVGWGALERDERGRYCIGLRLLEVASLAPRGHGLRQVALPFMGDLAEVTRQHVQLGVRDGGQATLIERLSAHQATPSAVRSWRRHPRRSRSASHLAPCRPRPRAPAGSAASRAPRRWRRSPGWPLAPGRVVDRRHREALGREPVVEVRCGHAAARRLARLWNAPFCMMASRLPAS
jgi:hypothetical protein